MSKNDDHSFQPPGEFIAQLIQRGMAAMDIYHAPQSGTWGPKSRDALNRAWVRFQGENAETFLAAEGDTLNAGIGQRIAELAKGEVGTTEEGGNNRGPEIIGYQQATWLDPGAWPWCAAFVCWVICEALKGRQIPADFNRPRTAGAWDFERWAREDGGRSVHLYKPPQILPEAGDIVVFTFSHIGIVAAPQSSADQYLKTVEGNTNAAGSREGDGVFLKLRKLKHVRSLIRLKF